MISGLAHAATTANTIRFSGYAAIFDSVDRGGDIIRRGAFAASLARLRKSGAPIAVPLLWQHDAQHAVGRIISLDEDETGLRITAELFSGSTAPVDRVATGAVTGLSFGYRVAQSRHNLAGTIRELVALELVEISLVTAPMQPLARINAVEKAARIHAVEPVLPP